MFSIVEDLSKAMAVTGSPAIKLDLPASVNLRDRIFSRYTTGLNSWPMWLWEHLPDRVVFPDPNGWRLIAEFSPSDPVILFFNTQDETSMFLFGSGTDLAGTLAECVGFEVYFTDPDASYLLIHNHHDNVVACGRAKEWLEKQAR